MVTDEQAMFYDFLDVHISRFVSGQPGSSAFIPKKCLHRLDAVLARFVKLISFCPDSG